MTTLGTCLFTLLCGKPVGEDNFGNRYYVSKKADASGAIKRWVIYKGEVEASKVPAEWHGWLHYRTDTLPASTFTRYPWQKPHTPNRTGSPQAYLPSGHPLKGATTPKATGDYESWQP